MSNQTDSNTNLKWLIGILIVIVIVLSGIIIYSKLGTSTVQNQVKTTINDNQSTTPTQTPQSTTNQVKDNETADWKTYENTKYKYSLKYPNNYIVSANAPVSTVKETSDLSIDGANNLWDSQLFNVEVRDLDFYKKYNAPSDLKSYVEKVWQMNKDDKVENKKVTNIVEKTIAGLKAYSFTTSYTYKSISGGYMIPDSQNTYSGTEVRYYLENGNYRYEIHFFNNKTDNLKLSEAILSTFQFTK